jgi:hypothetical protein
MGFIVRISRELDPLRAATSSAAASRSYAEQLLFPVPVQNPPKVTATSLGYPGTAVVSNVTATDNTIRAGAVVFAGDPATFAPTVHWQAMGS